MRGTSTYVIGKETERVRAMSVSSGADALNWILKERSNTLCRKKKVSVYLVMKGQAVIRIEIYRWLEQVSVPFTPYEESGIQNG